MENLALIDLSLSRLLAIALVVSVLWVLNYIFSNGPLKLRKLVCSFLVVSLVNAVAISFGSLGLGKTWGFLSG